MRIWDTHCHLTDHRFDADRGAVLSRAIAVGVEGVVVVAAEPGMWDAPDRLSADATPPQPERASATASHGTSSDEQRTFTRPRLLFAYGLHPHEARLGSRPVWEDLETRLRTADAVAVGEMGLDYHYDSCPRDRQREAFERQLHLAMACDLPVILHERDAAADLMSVLRTTGLPPRGGVWHCFSGDAALAEDALALGLCLGFGGLVTFERGTVAVRQAAAACPSDRLLLETDAPYLAPVPHRGGRNEPAFAADVLAFLARLRGESPEDLAAATTSAAIRLFASQPQDERVLPRPTGGPSR